MFLNYLLVHSNICAVTPPLLLHLVMVEHFWSSWTGIFIFCVYLARGCWRILWPWYLLWGMSSLGLLRPDNNPSSWLCVPMKEGDLFNVGQTSVGNKSICSSIRSSCIPYSMQTSIRITYVDANRDLLAILTSKLLSWKMVIRRIFEQKMKYCFLKK